MSISAEEWQLSSFFEVEPERLDPDSPWPYTEVVYELERAGLWLRCAIAPAYRDVRLAIRCGETLLYELEATGALDVIYERDPRGECLRIRTNASDSIALRLRPRVEIVQIADPAGVRSG